MPPAITPDDTSPNDPSSLREDVKHMTLGSRKNLGINPKVNKLTSATALNKRCLGLLQPGTSSDYECSFLPSKETEAVVNELRDHALAKICAIEDLGSLGKKLAYAHIMLHVQRPSSAK